jgi:hypothetical protein
VSAALDSARAAAAARPASVDRATCDQRLAVHGVRAEHQIERTNDRHAVIVAQHVGRRQLTTKRTRRKLNEPPDRIERFIGCWIDVDAGEQELEIDDAEVACHEYLSNQIE